MKLNLKDNLKGRLLLLIMYLCEIIDMSIYFITFSLVVSDLRNKFLFSDLVENTNQ
jgi:hypothetical protein